MANQTEDKDAILSEVVLDKLHHFLLVGVAFELVHETEVFLDVAVTIRAEGRPQDPGEERETGEERNENHPEPQEKVDLLIEEVNRQHALDRVALNVAKTTHLEVAHRHTRETWRGRPVFSICKRTDDVNSVHVEISA